MMRKWIAAALGAFAILGLCGCDNTPDTMVYVQNVGEITGTGAIAAADKFAGVVVSENVEGVQRDDGRAIAELFVSEGENVNKGDVLFEYDSEAMELELSKLQLELDRMKTTSSTLQTQISTLKSEQKKADKDDQLSYTVEIQTKEAEKKENDYNIKVKEREISRLKSTLSNAEVIAPVAGRVISINENGHDQNGNAVPYITIQKSGSYRIKGTINELSMGTIMEGTPMRILSRTDTDVSWTGTVSQIDMESVSQGSSYDEMFYSGISDLTSSSRYPFYVVPDNSEGLMLGQHVYMEVNHGGSSVGSGLWLPEYYICFDEIPGGEPAESETTEGETTEGETTLGTTAKAYVWAANEKDRLEKRYVTLGAYDDIMMTYEILEGLTAADFIAFPDESCKAGAGVTRDPGQGAGIGDDMDMPLDIDEPSEPMEVLPGVEDAFSGSDLQEDGVQNGDSSQTGAALSTEPSDVGSGSAGDTSGGSAGSITAPQPGNASAGNINPDSSGGTASSGDLDER